MKSFPLPKIHNPRERLVAARLARLREQLRMDVPTFARLCGVTNAALASHEAQARPWPADTIIKALPRIGEACAAFAAQLEDSSALMAEIEQDTRW